MSNKANLENSGTLKFVPYYKHPEMSQELPLCIRVCPLSLWELKNLW